MQKFSSLALLAIFGITVLLPGATPTSRPQCGASLAAKPVAEPTIPPNQRPRITSLPAIVVETSRIGANATESCGVLVETGAPVRKGQLLARLDDRQLTPT